jgi:hypothetical protein
MDLWVLLNSGTQLLTRCEAFMLQVLYIARLALLNPLGVDNRSPFPFFIKLRQQNFLSPPVKLAPSRVPFNLIPSLKCDNLTLCHQIKIYCTGDLGCDL